jgi:hypothetical protein
MNQALYAHMNNKRKMKKKKDLTSLYAKCGVGPHLGLFFQSKSKFALLYSSLFDSTQSILF